MKPMNKFPIYLLITLLMVLGYGYIKLSAASADKYVSVDGDDSWPGTLTKPWKTINHAAKVLTAGQRVYIRGGTYMLDVNIMPANSGTAKKWISYEAYPGEKPVIDGINVPFDVRSPDEMPAFEQGIFYVLDKSHIRIKGLTIKNSHGAGLMFRRCNNIEVIGNAVTDTFGPGIACWKGRARDFSPYSHFKVIGNYLSNTNSYDLDRKPRWRMSEPPHEAISMAGVSYFEVAYNELDHCDKEGIDIKENASHGVVHHNYVHGVTRQGLYADAWFGELTDIEFHHNVVTDSMCGIAVSSENGPETSDIRIHHNLLYKNNFYGVYFSEWGADLPRRNILIENNTLWMNYIGGIYFSSDNISDVSIRNNIIAENALFQIGFSDRWSEDEIREKNIEAEYNLICQSKTVTYPVWTWSPKGDRWASPCTGANTVSALPGFTDAANDIYTLAADSAAIDAGKPGKSYNDPNRTRSDIGFMYFKEPDWAWWLESDFPAGKGEKYLQSKKKNKKW
ncbi:MAG: right-handed parallel beta-helix repeat-containing protein [Bacillota bacterium]